MIASYCFYGYFQGKIHTIFITNYITEKYNQKQIDNKCEITHNRVRFRTFIFQINPYLSPEN